MRWSHELEENPRPAVLFLDELSQATLHLLLDGTNAMPKVEREAIKAIERLIRNPEVTVIAAEAGIGDIELEWLQACLVFNPTSSTPPFAGSPELFIGAATAGQHRQAPTAVPDRPSIKSQQVWLSMGEAESLKKFSAFPSQLPDPRRQLQNPGGR